jgi:predicted permease
LSPSYRRADERDMQEEIDALEQIAGRKELGNLTLAREDARAAWGWSWLDGMARDVKYACRTLARQRGFAAVAVVSLALGIGANAAIFTLMDALLWRQLPVREPDRLVSVDNVSGSYFGYSRLAAGSGEVMESVFATSALNRLLDAGGGETPGRLQLVTGNFFPGLGVNAAWGRVLTPDDDRREAPARVAVISHDYWLRTYGGSRDAVGRTLHIDRAAFTVVGVAPAEFFGISVGEAPEVWIPVTTLPSVLPSAATDLDRKNTNFLYIAGRLKPGVTMAHAAEALGPLAIQIDLERNGPPQSEADRRALFAEKVRLTPASQGISGMRDRFSKPLRVVFWMVTIGLLLACVNVMSLQFARADERRRELTVRLAIGASRFRIARQLLAESMLIAAVSGVVGLAMCQPLARGLTSLLMTWGQPLHLILPVNYSILFFVTGISVAAALISGVAPAMRATRGAAMPALQQGSRTSTAAPGRRILGRAITATQMALSLVLVAAACLFAYNLHHLREFDSGVQRGGLLIVDVDPAGAGYRDAAAIRLNMDLRARLAALPGVAGVSFSQNGLYTGRNSDTNFYADGFPSDARGNHHSIYDHVGPDFFTVAGAHIVAGRDFNEHDDAAAPKVAILSKSLARRIFHDRSPIGLQLYAKSGPTTEEAYRIVGVVNDIRNDIHRGSAMFYLCQLQSGRQAMSTRLLVRAQRDPGTVAAGIRAAVRDVDRSLRVDDLMAADELFDRTVDRDRLLAILSWGFGVLALTLAAVGIYGLLSFDVTRRTGEIGIRMAVGARRSDIMTLVLREVAIVSGIGLVVGILAAMQLSRLVESLVWGFKPGDPRVAAAAAAVLVIVALGAALIPARRASRMDPMNALRCE